MGSGAWVVRCVLAGLMVVSTGCVRISWSTQDDGKRDFASADLLAGVWQDLPQVPVVVPIELPDGFSYRGPSWVGSVVRHTYLGHGTDVDVCIRPRDRDIVGACVPTMQPDLPVLGPWEFGEYHAVIALNSHDVPGEVVAAWSAVTLTDRWEMVAWLQEPRH